MTIAVQGTVNGSSILLSCEVHFPRVFLIYMMSHAWDFGVNLVWAVGRNTLRIRFANQFLRKSQHSRSRLCFCLADNTSTEYTGLLSVLVCMEFRTTATWWKFNFYLCDKRQKTTSKVSAAAASPLKYPIHRCDWSVAGGRIVHIRNQTQIMPATARMNSVKIKWSNFPTRTFLLNTKWIGVRYVSIFNSLTGATASHPSRTEHRTAALSTHFLRPWPSCWRNSSKQNKQLRWDILVHHVKAMADTLHSWLPPPPPHTHTLHKKLV